MTDRLPIILDTDPGVGIPGTDADDPIALFLALAHPALELLAVTTTFGNCPSWLSARGASAVLEAVGREDIPIAAGQTTPWRSELPEVLRQAYAGVRGRPGRIDLPAPAATQDAAELITQIVRSRPGEVTIVAVGPQTNIACAIELDPLVARDLRSIVFMGGGIGVDTEYGRGNVTPVAECNIYFDPEAAEAVLESGIPTTMVGLDVTNPNTGLILTDEHIRSIDRSASPAAALFADISRTYLEAPMFDWGHGCVLYDPLAVLAAAEPATGSYRDLTIAVETAGRHTRGETVPLPPGDRRTRVMVEVDGQAAIERILHLIRNFTAPPRASRENKKGTS